MDEFRKNSFDVPMSRDERWQNITPSRIEGGPPQFHPQLPRPIHVATRPRAAPMPDVPQPPPPRTLVCSSAENPKTRMQTFYTSN